jgi:two-component system, cell cycle sensor histidine kinase and response regulator CckA
MGDSEQEAMTRRLGIAVATWEIGIFEHDYASGETWASPRFREMLGFEPDEPVSMTEVARQTFPADVPMVHAAILKANSPDGDGLFDMIYRVIRKDGEVRWVRGRGGTAFAEVDGQRVQVRTTGTILDVTEREDLRLAAERQERRLSEAMATSQVGVFDWDHDPARPEQALYWSPNYRKMSGYDPHELPDLDWYLRRVHPDDIGRFHEALRSTMNPLIRSAFEVEYRWFHPSGETRWFVARSTTSFHQKGPELLPQRTVGAVLDITSTMRAAEQLAQRSAILDATPDIVCIADPNLQLVFLNQAGRTFSGIDAEVDITNHSLTDIAGPGFDEKFVREGRHAAMSQGSWQVQMDFENRNGETSPVSALLLCHWDKHGQPAHFSLVARDLSNEKRLEEQFRQAQKMEVIGRLAGGVAHDFNNILSVILGFSDVLEDKLLPDSSGRREIQEIRIAAERAASLTRQLLAISRKELVQPRAININEVLKAAIPMFRRLIDATVDMNLALSDVPALVKADPSQIEQVLLNLVVNARDAMPAGGELQLEVSQVVHRPETAPPGLTLTPGPYVVFSVSDSGHGMSPEIQKRVFEPFFTTKEAGKGTGLGLSTVFDIVAKCGGGIWLHSELHKGTTFKVYLPATDEAPEPMTEYPSSPIQHKGGTILIVEDEVQLRTMLVTILSRAGYRVLEASGPVEALGLAKGFDERIDLLLTDVVMPQMTGPLLAAELKNRRPEMVVLYMSGYTEDTIVHRGLIDDKLNFLPKPLSVASLLRKVAQLVAHGATRVA